MEVFGKSFSNPSCQWLKCYKPSRIVICFPLADLLFPSVYSLSGCQDVLHNKKRLFLGKLSTTENFLADNL